MANTIIDTTIFAKCKPASKTTYNRMYFETMIELYWESSDEVLASSGLDMLLELRNAGFARDGLMTFYDKLNGLKCIKLAYSVFSQQVKMTDERVCIDNAELLFAKSQARGIRADQVLGLKRAKVELTQRYGVQHPTIATLKLIEILRHYNILARTAQDTLHVHFAAELPGAFVSIMEHIVSAQYPSVKYTWEATSLLDNGTALGDLYGYYDRHRSNWLMSDENNGDVTCISNLVDFERRAKRADIAMHDLGVHLDNPMHEEAENLKPNAGATFACLSVLKDGGTFIGKHFTMYSGETHSRIALYASMFTTFYMCKPYASKASNSEIYLVGIGFKSDVFNAHRASMLDWISNPTKVEQYSVLSKIQGTLAFRQRRAIRTFKGSPKSYINHWLANNSVPPRQTPGL